MEVRLPRCQPETDEPLKKKNLHGAFMQSSSLAIKHSLDRGNGTVVVS